MKKLQIDKNGKKYEHLSTARLKLNLSAPQVRAMCKRGDLLCVQAGGSWYVEIASMQRGMRMIQENRFKKEITLSKLRKSEISAIKSRSKSARRLVGGEIRLRRS